jgi:hypothetical protein
MTRAFPHGPFRKVKAQTCLSHFGIWAVTAKTATREDWLHVLIEIETARRSAMTTDKNTKCDGHNGQREGQFRISTRFMI